MSSRPKPWYSERDCKVCTRGASSFRRDPLYSFAHAMRAKWRYHAKFQHFQSSFWKGWNLTWYHHFTHIACEKSREGHGENWTHLVYKLDNPFRSIRVSDENSSVTRALQCFLNLFELQPIFAFSIHHSKRRHQFPTRSDIICCFSVIYRFV